MPEKDKFAEVYIEIVQGEKLSSDKAGEIFQKILKALEKLQQH